MAEGTPVSLRAMLERREARAAEQQRMLREHGVPLISYTLNIAGPVKTGPRLRLLFGWGLARIREALDRRGMAVLGCHELHSATGDECLMAVDAPAAKIKALMVGIEEGHPAARLLDIDVLDEGGAKLSRPAPRRCLLCARAAADCVRSRRHPLAELEAKTQELVDSLFPRAS